MECGGGRLYEGNGETIEDQGITRNGGDAESGPPGKGMGLILLSAVRNIMTHNLSSGVPAASQEALLLWRWNRVFRNPPDRL